MIEKKKLKINFIAPDYRITGGMQMIIRHTKALNQRGHSAVIYTSIIPPTIEKYGPSFYGLYRLCRGTIRRLKEKELINRDIESGIIVNIPILKNHFIRDADATFATAWPTAYCVNELDSSKGVKFYFLQDYESWDLEGFPHALQRLEQSYKLPLTKICVSKSLANLINHKYNVESLFVRNWIEEAFYYNGGKDYSKRIRLLLVGSKSFHKGTQIAIKAYKLVRKKYSDVDMVVFSRNKLTRLASGIEFFHNPPRKTIFELYKKSHILISPSFIEGFGLPIIEGMASKCAVIATPLGVASDIGKDSENLVFFEPGNIEQLSQKIIQLVTNRELLKKIANRGHVEAKRFEKNTLISNFERIIFQNILK